MKTAYWVLVFAAVFSVAMLPLAAAPPHHGGGGNGPLYFPVKISNSCPQLGAGFYGWNIFAFNVDENGDGYIDSVIFAYESNEIRLSTGALDSPWDIYQVTSPSQHFNLWELTIQGYYTDGKCDTNTFSTSYGDWIVHIASHSIYQTTTTNKPYFIVSSSLTVSVNQAVTLTLLSYAGSPPPSTEHAIVNAPWMWSPGPWGPYGFGAAEDSLTSWLTYFADFTTQTCCGGNPAYNLYYYFLTQLPQMWSGVECVQGVGVCGGSGVHPQANLYLAHNSNYPSESWPFQNPADIGAQDVIGPHAPGWEVT